MTKKFKTFSVTKNTGHVTPKRVLISNGTDVQLISYLIIFIALHNLSLHHGSFHTVHKEAVIVSILIIVYQPLLSAVKQARSIKSFVKGTLKAVIHGLFIGELLYLLPKLSRLLLTPSITSLAPIIAIVLIFTKKPSNVLPALPSKSASSEDIRKYCETLMENLKNRARYVLTLGGCYAFFVCYLPYTFAQSSTVLRHCCCLKAQKVTSFLHIIVLLIVQLLPTDLSLKVTEAAGLLGRWQCAVLSDTSDTIPEWKESGAFGHGSVTRWDGSTYLATSPVTTCEAPAVSAKPGLYSHTLFYLVFHKSFRLLKILTLVEGLLVAVLFYQTLSLKFVQQFLPSTLLIFLHLYTILGLAKEAQKLRPSNKSV